MSHPSGITASKKLIKDIIYAKQNNIRCLQIRIEGESLVTENQDEVNGTFSDDFDRCIFKYIKSNKCCYILFRGDDKTSIGYRWLFLNWIPENAPIREKMLYASTKSTVKREFGESHFFDDITGHETDDLTYARYLKHIESKSAPPPLTLVEQELQDIILAERQAAHDDGHRTLKCAGFPPTPDLIKELDRFVAETIDFLEIMIVIDKETIKSGECLQKLSCDSLRSKIHPDRPRYYLFRFRHTFEMISHKSIIFIYNMPGYKASVKEKMLYSSCKSPFIELLQSHFKINIQKKLEVNSGDFCDLDVNSLLLDLHPPQIDTKSKMAKAMGQGGPKRLF